MDWEQKFPFLREKGHVVSLIGGGGKTTLLYALSAYCTAKGWRVFSTDEIFEKVWNEKVYEANNTVMVHIRRLRGKMKEDTRQNKIITTVWGVGYKIEK